jgi:hypothetical protein
MQTGHPGSRGVHSAQTFDSSGPSVRIRGTAHQSFERHIAPGAWATTAGGRIAAENFYQHAEHYFRINNASALTNQPPPHRHHRSPRVGLTPSPDPRSAHADQNGAREAHMGKRMTRKGPAAEDEEIADPNPRRSRRSPPPRRHSA